MAGRDAHGYDEVWRRYDTMRTFGDRGCPDLGISNSRTYYEITTLRYYDLEEVARLQSSWDPACVNVDSRMCFRQSMTQEV